jgi:hypothetical protein
VAVVAETVAVVTITKTAINTIIIKITVVPIRWERHRLATQ